MKLIHLIKQNEGAGLAEYAILLLLVAIVCIATVRALGETLGDMFNNIIAKFP